MMNHLHTRLTISILLLLLGMVSITSAQESTPPVADPLLTPEPVRIIESETAAVALYFNAIQQGRIGLISITGNSINQLEGTIFNQSVSFFQINGDPAHYAVIAVSIDRPIRTYELTISINEQVLRIPVDVISGGFIQQQVTLIDDNTLETLLDPEIEAQEVAQIFEMASVRTEQVLWDQNEFLPPLNTELTSPFGAVRIFNEIYNTIHTGWDFQAQMGMPMITSARGRVVFAGLLPIRGNYVLVDHGVGLFSGYAHLSVSFVTQGQLIESGQIIGLVGSTGRSSSAHAHLEFLANGMWTDAANILQMNFPFPAETP